MASVFDKLGGIRPLAVKLGVPSSTVMSWAKKGIIPVWRHGAILDLARVSGVDLALSELTDLKPQADRATQDAERAA